MCEKYCTLSGVCIALLCLLVAFLSGAWLGPVGISNVQFLRDVHCRLWGGQPTSFSGGQNACYYELERWFAKTFSSINWASWVNWAESVYDSVKTKPWIYRQIVVNPVNYIVPPTPLNFSTNAETFWNTVCFLVRYCGFSGLILGKIAFNSVPLSLAYSRFIDALK